MIHRGGCHCGNLRFSLDTPLALHQLPLRACQCSFCRQHGAVSTSDPAGAVHFEIGAPDRVVRYRFGLRTADFLICGTCGVYVAATMVESGATWAIVNANALDETAQLTQAVAAMSYDGEDEAGRRARRRARWSPVPGGT